MTEQSRMDRLIDAVWNPPLLVATRHGRKLHRVNVHPDVAEFLKTFGSAPRVRLLCGPTVKVAKTHDGPRHKTTLCTRCHPQEHR